MLFNVTVPIHGRHPDEIKGCAIRMRLTNCHKEELNGRNLVNNPDNGYI